MEKNKDTEPTDTEDDMQYSYNPIPIRTPYERAEAQKRARDEEEEYMKEAYSYKKRPRSNNSNIWPKYIMIEGTHKTGSHLLEDLSPFAVSKHLKHMIQEPVSIRKLRSGSLLVEVQDKKQSDKLLKLSQLGYVAIKTSPHRSLNEKKGIIRCAEFKGMTDDDLSDELSEQGVTEVKRIRIYKNGTHEDTNTFILTFGTHTLPKFITAGYLRLPVSHYIPQPLRCYKCQKFGHHKEKCRGTELCQVCSEEGHNQRDCKKPPCCRNCKGSHPSYDKTCPTWIKEKEITKVKTEQNISYPEARRLCEPKNVAGSVSYAQAAATSTASKSTATTKSIGTQTELTFDKETKNFKEMPKINNKTQATPSTSTQTTTQTSQTNSKQQPRPKPVVVTPRNKPGPASSKPKTTVRSQNTTKKEKLKKTTKKKEQVEIEISNRYDSLSSCDEEGKIMDTSPSEPSSVVRDQAVEKHKD